MFLLDQIMPGLGAYNVPTLVRVGTTLDADHLREAFQTILERHEVLRTRLSLVDGEPVQEAYPAPRFELGLVDLRASAANAARSEADRLVGDLAWRPFDLGADLLLRATLIHLPAGVDELLVVVHHIGSDHLSGGLLLDELDAIYTALGAGGAPELPELPIQYADFAAWQRDQLSGEPLAEALDYWREQLAGAPERLDLPSDRPRPKAQSFRGQRLEVPFDRELVAPLRELAREQRVSLFMVLLAGFTTVVHRYTGVDDVVLGTPVSGRHHDEIGKLLGYFSNTLALRTDLSGDPTFSELLDRVKLTTLGALAYQELPFEKLVEVLNPERARSHSPIFQSLFAYDRVDAGTLQLDGHSVERVSVPGWELARFDLSITIKDRPDGSLLAHVGFATDLFDEARIERLVGHFQTLLAAVAESPETRLSQLPLLTGAERELILGTWNDTASGFDCRCLHELFAEQAALRPDALAVLDASVQMSYGELDARANRLARELRELGAGPGVLVGICLERSAELVVALLATLKTGAAYVPIEPSYPPQRQEFMLADAAAPVLVTQEQHLGTVDARGARVLCVDRDGDRERIAAHSPAAIDAPVPADPERLAYVIYTSGSTGQPKGVEITHRSVANLMASMRQAPGLAPDDVLVNLTTPAFDLSVPDWYLPLTTGARIAIAPRDVTLDGVELAGWLTRVGATFVQATPTTWQLLVDSGWKGRPTLKIVCGGEALPRALAEQLLDLGASLWHMYGPTETTVWSSIHQLRDSLPAIAGPIANTTFHLLDGHRQPVPIGVAGELYIGGQGLARGYRHRAELTAEKFLDDPFATGGTLYRTGDLLRWRENGTLEFLGRIDHQVKLRGFRIELGEIESVLDSHPSVGGSVAVVREDTPGDQRLVAYLVAADPSQPPDADELRRLLRMKLSPFMVPSALVILDAFPVTANGKLDRVALPRTDGVRAPTAVPFTAPQTPVQESLAAVWSAILGVDRVGIDDDFFDLGGHSLLAVKMLAQVQETLGIELALGSVFDHATIRGLSAEISSDLVGAAEDDDLAALLAEVEASER